MCRGNFVNCLLLNRTVIINFNGNCRSVLQAAVFIESPSFASDGTQFNFAEAEIETLMN